MLDPVPPPVPAAVDVPAGRGGFLREGAGVLRHGRFARGEIVPDHRDVVVHEVLQVDEVPLRRGIFREREVHDSHRLVVHRVVGHAAADGLYGEEQLAVGGEADLGHAIRRDAAPQSERATGRPRREVPGVELRPGPVQFRSGIDGPELVAVGYPHEAAVVVVADEPALAGFHVPGAKGTETGT